MSNGTTRANKLESYGLTRICQDIVGEWLINLGFKYNSAVKNYYVGGHEKKDIIW